MLRNTNILLAPLLAFAFGTAHADRVDNYIKTAMSRQHIPGLSLAVILNGKVVKCRGYGFASLELRVPASPNSVYELASLTKSFVSNAILLLKQDGKLRLEDSLSTYVTDLPDTCKAITIRQCLSHTSGIADYNDLNDLRQRLKHDAAPEDILNGLKTVPLRITPGAKWIYSNTDYILLGMVIRNITGETYDGFLAHRVFGLLGMTSTRRDSTDDVIPNRATGYTWDGAGGLHNAEFLSYMEMNHGDRGIVSTVKDLAKWDAALSSSFLFSDNTKTEMWSPITLNDGSQYSHGLGWFIDKVNGHRHISHAGGSPGTATIYARYPDDGLSVIVLTNGGAVNQFALDNGVAQCYVPALGPQGVVKTSPTILESYTGYGNVWGGTVMTIVKEGDALVVDDGGQLTGAFGSVSATKFTALDCNRGLTFTTDQLGKLLTIALRLDEWETAVQYIGPLASSVRPKADPDTARTLRIQKVLTAFEKGGVSVETADGVAPQARKDFARGPAPEFAGIRSISYIAEFDVAEKKIERHGAAVSSVLYYRLKTDRRQRYVLVYLTSDGLVTDQDVVDR